MCFYHVDFTAGVVHPVTFGCRANLPQLAREPWLLGLQTESSSPVLGPHSRCILCQSSECNLSGNTRWGSFQLLRTEICYIRSCDEAFFARKWLLFEALPTTALPLCLKILLCPKSSKFPSQLPFTAKKAQGLLQSSISLVCFQPVNFSFVSLSATHSDKFTRRSWVLLPTAPLSCWPQGSAVQRPPTHPAPGGVTHAPLSVHSS